MTNNANERDMAIPNDTNPLRPEAAAGDQLGLLTVITAFLWRDQRVLLALRSEAAAPFPGHWAGISSYFADAAPLAWALGAIHAQTGIPRAAVTLRRGGSPIVLDAAAKRPLHVHPFLFSVDDSVNEEHAWEATRLKWVDLSEIQRRERTPTVPLLAATFAQVWPPWPWRQAMQANVDLAFQWLYHDRQMGAGTLARAAARELLKLVRLTVAQPWEEARRPLRAAATRLRGDSGERDDRMATGSARISASNNACRTPARVLRAYSSWVDRLGMVRWLTCKSKDTRNHNASL